MAAIFSALSSRLQPNAQSESAIRSLRAVLFEGLLAFEMRPMQRSQHCSSSRSLFKVNTLLAIEILSSSHKSFSFPCTDRHLFKYLRSIFFTCCLSVLHLYRFKYRQFFIRIFSLSRALHPANTSHYQGLTRSTTAAHIQAHHRQENCRHLVRYELATSAASFLRHSHVAALRHDCFFLSIHLARTSPHSR